LSHQTPRDSIQAKMIKFVSGTIFGIIASTIGFGSVAKILDGAMFNIQKTTVELNRPQLPEPIKYTSN
jgi:hypothetical protein